MTMKEIAGVENTDNPKEAIRRMVIEAKQRRKALQIDDMESAVKITKKQQPV